MNFDSENVINTNQSTANTSRLRNQYDQEWVAGRMVWWAKNLTFTRSGHVFGKLTESINGSVRRKKPLALHRFFVLVPILDIFEGTILRSKSIRRFNFAMWTMFGQRSIKFWVVPVRYWRIDRFWRRWRKCTPTMCNIDNSETLCHWYAEYLFAIQ